MRRETDSSYLLVDTVVRGECTGVLRIVVGVVSAVVSVHASVPRR